MVTPQDRETCSECARVIDILERERESLDAFADRVDEFVNAVADLITDASSLMHDDDAADVLARFDALEKP